MASAKFYRLKPTHVPNHEYNSGLHKKLLDITILINNIIN